MANDTVKAPTELLRQRPPWDLVERIAASAQFHRSPRLRELLYYICEQALLNRPEELREQLIGYRVFGRDSDYSPGEDNIVRVEVRRLRKRLQEYFETEGKDEPTCIAIPKGSYVPVFEPRAGMPAERVAERPARSSRRNWMILGAAAIFVVLVCAWFLSHAGPSPAAERGVLWPLLFNHDQQTVIVCADSALVVAQVLRGKPLTLNEYMKRDYAASAPAVPDDVRRVLAIAPTWQFTDVADVRLVERLQRANHGVWGRTAIRSARTAQIQDFTTGNTVLLGSVRSNPWNELFAPQLNFRLEFEERTRTPRVRNLSPQSGEQALYSAAPPGSSGPVFSTIAFLPNLRRTGHVLMIGGTSGQGTETAGEYLTAGSTYSWLMEMLARRNGGELPYFELLLKSDALGGVAKGAEIVAVRIIVPGPRGL